MRNSKKNNNQCKKRKCKKSSFDIPIINTLISNAMTDLPQKLQSAAGCSFDSLPMTVVE